MQIGNKRIGAGHPCFLIAEAGVNHNGQYDLALKLIDVAAEAGADAVKFQTFKAENLVTPAAVKAKYQVENTGTNESQFDMLKKLELKYELHASLKEYAESKGLIFLSSPFDEESVEFLFELGVSAFKAGSGELTNLPFLRQIAAKGLPVILSSGMAVMEEVEDAIAAVYSTGNQQLAMLHCTSNYPCPPTEVNLRAMKTMQSKLECIVGYSDHTEGVQVSLMAVAMGAHILEKHFTLDKSMEGPDHKASLDPTELNAWVQEVRWTEKVLGSSEKKPNESELRIMQNVRKSIVAASNIPANTTITADMLTIKRPGTGIAPKHLEEMIGKKSKHDLIQDEVITWEDVS